MASGGGHEAPGTIFTWLYKTVKDTELGHSFGFNNGKWGQIWFETLCFAFIAFIVISVLSLLVSRIMKLSKVPHGLQNFFEIVIELLNKMVCGFIGPDGTKYLPYLGTLFLYILTMNLLGIIPAFRSPTMTLSTTLALGLTTIIMVQAYAIKANGIVGYFKHFAGGILWLAPLFIVVEIIGELTKPISLSLRLFCNIFGEDTMIEKLVEMGGWIPLQFPMLIFAVFTSFLQAFIFTALSSIYIAFLTQHEDKHETHKEH